MLAHIILGSKFVLLLSATYLIFATVVLLGISLMNCLFNHAWEFDMDTLLEITIQMALTLITSLLLVVIMSAIIAIAPAIL